MRKPTLIGPLSTRSSANGHYQPAPMNFAAPTLVHNAMSRDPLQLSKLWTSPMRPGADDFRRCPSKGVI
jgi:hypothetical protein